MFTANRESDATDVYAFDVNRTDAPFRCPECAKQVILKQGRIRLAHFAHKPPVTCQYGLGETEAHRRCKKEIFDVLSKRSDIEKLKLERRLDDVRPDISFLFRGTYVAIEVQISELPYETILRRTRSYAAKKIHLLWLAQWDSDLDEDQYSPALWERWCHAAYFGRVYYWTNGTNVSPYAFEEYLLEVRRSEFYTKSGEHKSFGGYLKRSHRFRTPVQGPELDILDFKPKVRPAWSGGDIEIPEAFLFMDKFRKKADLFGA